MSIKALNFSEFIDFSNIHESEKPNPSLLRKVLQDTEKISKSSSEKTTSPLKDVGKIKAWDIFSQTKLGQDIISAIKAEKELYALWQDAGIVPKEPDDSPLSYEEIEEVNRGRDSDVKSNFGRLEKLGLGSVEKPQFNKITSSSNYKFGDYQKLSWDDLKNILDKNNFSDEMDFSKYNIVALRNFIDIKKSYPNRFTDLIVLMSPEKEKNVTYFPSTTVPGEAFLVQKFRNWYIANGSPLNPEGLAILQPGVYSYKLGKHKGKYDALVQSGPVKVQRYTQVDSESKAKFSTFSPGKSQTGSFGINIHRANSTGTTETVDTHSAGCLVLQNSNDFSSLISTIRKSRQKQIDVALVELDDVGKNFLASLTKNQKDSKEKSS
jgi:hypothetical protein